jgi:hypothetical protein
MNSKLKDIVNNIKNVNTKTILNAIKSSQSAIVDNNVINLATNVVDKAKTVSKEEVTILLNKISNLEKMTNQEIEKVAFVMVDKFLEDKSKENIPESVKKEIVMKLTAHNRGKNIFPIIKYVNNVIVKNIPTNIQSVKNLRANISTTLIQDANNTLKGKSAA